MAKLFEVMGQRGPRNAGFVLDIGHNQSGRMSGQKQSHDTQPRPRTDRIEHFRVAIDIVARWGLFRHSSMILEV